MKKIAFFLDNAKNASVDCRNVFWGNPGVGGSEFEIILISAILARRKNDLKICLYAISTQNLPQDAELKAIDSFDSAVRDAVANDFDYFVCDRKSNDWKKNAYFDLNTKMRFIIWCHNFMSRHELRWWSGHPHLGKIICVGKEQLDLLCDEYGWNRCDYIYNCVPFDDKKIADVLEHLNEGRGHIVTYVGSLIPAKSFHILAELWPCIKKKVPDAQLYVVGSGSLYNRNAKMGKYGIAESSYENVFMPYLIDKDSGLIDSSVHFMGNMGLEKNDLLLKTKVGVPNPLGTSETFCISAVEMQAMGCQIAVMEAPGYYDTVSNGYIAKSKKDLAQCIIKLLLSSDNMTGEKIMELTEKFSIEKVASKWECMFDSDIMANSYNIFPLTNPLFRMKWLKNILRVIKERIPLLYDFLLPVESFYKLVRK